MRFGQREVANVTFYNFESKEPELYLDSLKLSSVGSDTTITWATGGQGNPRLLGWEGQRNVTFKAQDALATMESIAMLSGSPVTLGSGSTPITMYAREVLKVVKETGYNKITLTNTPITPTSTNFFVYKASSAVDTEKGAKLTYESGGGTPTAAGKFTVSNKIVKVLADDCAENTYVTVFYLWSDTSTTTKKVSFKSDTFGGYYTIVGDTLIKGENGTNYPFQIVIAKAKILSKWDYEFKNEGDSVVFDFEFEAAKDLTTNELVTLTAQFASNS